MEVQKTKYRIAILDNGEIETLRRLSKEHMNVEQTLESYDYILIPGWIWVEVCDSKFRKSFIEDLILKGYPIKIVQEKKYVDIVTEELTLISLFEMAIRPYGQLKGYFNRCILNGKDKEDIDYFYEEWIDKIYDEWPLTSAVITTGNGKKRVKKKNAGEISAVFLASILAYQKEKEVEVTIWSRDADCRMCMTELANQINSEHLALRGEAIASFKNVDIVLREIFRKKLIEITDWNRIVDNVREERRIIYVYKKDDHSNEIRTELVDNIRFKKLVIDDNIDLIW